MFNFLYILLLNIITKFSVTERDTFWNSLKIKCYVIFSSCTLRTRDIAVWRKMLLMIEFYLSKSSVL